MSTQGHNSAAYGQELLDEFDFRAFFDFVCSSHASMAEKMLTLIHARRAGPHGEPGTISRAEAMKLASCSSATFQRAIPIVRIFFEIEQKRGKPTMYKPDRAITADQIEAAITTIRDGGMYQKDTSKLIDTSASITQSDASKSSIDQNDTSNPSIGMHHADTYQQKEIPPTPPKEKTTPSKPIVSFSDSPARKRTGRNFWEQQLNPHAAAAHEDVWWEDGRLAVANGFQIELEKTLPQGLDLRTALDAAGGWIEMHWSGLELKKRVRSQFARAVQQRVEQDRRYEKAKQQNDSNRSRTNSGSVPIKLDDSDRPKTKPRPREEVEI